MQTLDLVIVTYNRLEKLKISLQHYMAQTHAFRNLIIVDNCSTDGTKEYLDEWERNAMPLFNKIIIHNKENLGGSGGFYLGQKKAMELKADWVFVADDDAYADPTMVERFYDFIKSHDTSKISAVCAKVLNLDGSICLYHRDRHCIVDGEYKRESAKIEEYNKESFSIDALSYVGSFLNAKALKKRGLVNPKYFIYFDDTEHSIRLKKYGDIVVAPNIKIVHEGAVEILSDRKILTWRKYYMLRNKNHMLIKHFPKVGLLPIYYLIKTDIYMVLHCKKADEQFKLYRKAMYDSLFCLLGKNRLYKPGWRTTIV